MTLFEKIEFYILVKLPYKEIRKPVWTGFIFNKIPDNSMGPRFLHLQNFNTFEIFVPLIFVHLNFCVSIFLRACPYFCVRTHIFACVPIFLRACPYFCVRVHIFACVSIFLHARVYFCVRVLICVRVYIFACMYIFLLGREKFLRLCMNLCVTMTIWIKLILDIYFLFSYPDISTD